MKIELTKEELSLVLSALAELPAKTSYNLITKLLKESAAVTPEE